jgi:hypothetical protein
MIRKIMLPLAFGILLLTACRAGLGTPAAPAVDSGAAITQASAASANPDSSRAPALAEIAVTIDRSTIERTSALRLGVTHTQYSVADSTNAAAVRAAEDLLRDAAVFQNQHLMGWGALNPEPSPGVYDWTTLDARIDMIRSMGAVPVITLCCAPDWMKGGKPGQTDWSRLDSAPLPGFYGAFAELSAAAARRYPDVQYFQVWNEMKGFWNASLDNWDFAAYTDLYNAVYDALKAVRSDIQVGGPYLVVEGTGSNRGGWPAETPIRARQWEGIRYWLEHKHGAEFITLDRSWRDWHDPYAYDPADLLALTHLYRDVADQIRRETDLPLWWAEYYTEGFGPNAAAQASVLYHMLMGGSAAALLWNPLDNGETSHGIIRDVRAPDGGQPTVLYEVFRGFHDYFGAGTSILKAASSSPDVEVLASPGKTMLINKRPGPVSVRLGAATMTIPAYSVLFIDTP